MNPAYQHARFLVGAAGAGQFPPDQGVEVAFAGRSNVGKSSAINALTGRKGLARTSKTPGRTQQINFFGLDDERRLVDLPGYGYAKVPDRLRHQWQQLMERYLGRRQALRGLVVIMDSRRPLTEFDQLMLDWCIELSVPAHCLLTKADKLGRGAAKEALERAYQALQETYGGTRGAQLTLQAFSATKRQGVEEAQAVLDHWFGYSG